MSSQQRIPDGLVVLTFDDGVRSHYDFVAPILSQVGFGATFFITEGLRFLEDKTRYLTWEQVADLDARGFEIGNHTRHHESVTTQSDAELLADIEHIDRRCAGYGIARPVSFCYPGYSNKPGAVAVLRKRGFAYARRGTDPEFDHDREGGRGPAYDPGRHDPLLVPTTGAAGPRYDFDDLRWSLDQAKDGKVAVLTFHGVPDLEHPWVHTAPDVFETYVAYLSEQGHSVVALRDLAGYAPARGPARDG